MNWTMVDVAKQAVVLYEGLREEAERKHDAHGANFWASHRNTAYYAIRGTATPVTEEAISRLIDDWNHRPAPVQGVAPDEVK